MRVFKCVFSHAEMVSDSYKMENVYQNQIFKVEGKLVSESDEINEALLGANASAEEAAEQNTCEAKQGCNIVLANRLVDMGGFENKKDFVKYFKGHLKRIKDYMEENGRSEEDVKAFEAGLKEFVMYVAKNIKEFQFFLDESSNFEEVVPALCIYEDVTPVMYFIKEAVYPEKQ